MSAQRKVLVTHSAGQLGEMEAGALRDPAGMAGHANQPRVPVGVANAQPASSRPVTADHARALHVTWTAAPVQERNELEQILALQRENLAFALAPEVARAQGFVTVQHTLENLEQMHALAPSIVVKTETGLAGYALTMLLAARPCVPILEPMFQMLEALTWRGLPLASLRYYVMGQICVAEEHRGQGVFDALYAGHRTSYADRFQLLITEIALRNARSLRAHERVGSRPPHRYHDAVDDWLIVAWDFH